MTSLVLNPFRVNNAATFAASFASTPTYLVFGQSKPWTATTQYPTASDLNPLPPENTSGEIIRTRKTSVGAKRIQGADIMQAIPNNTWATGTVYAQYDSEDENLYSKAFYVVTSAYGVFKCLFNNFGASSTVEPTGTSNFAITTADGYVWKYMYTISPANILKFYNSYFAPVESNSVVAGAAVSGEIWSIAVDAGGTGYTSGTSVPVTITGDGSGAVATATVVSGVVTKIKVTSAGSGYTYANITMTGGTGLAAHANLAPVGGHGSNPFEELGAFYAMTATTMTGNENGDLSVANDFRSIYMLQSPLDSTGVSSYAANTAKMTYRINVASSSGFVVDSSGVAGTATFDIVEVGTGYIDVTNVSGSIPSSGSVSGTSGGISSITSVVLPEIKLTSGKVLYVDHRSPVVRGTSQIETIRVVIQF
jgi:hypothetical protein